MTVELDSRADASWPRGQDSGTASIAPQPFLGQKADGGVDMARAGGSLLLCLLLAVGLIFLIRKIKSMAGGWPAKKGQSASAASRLKVVESVRLNPTTTLYLVDFGTGISSQTILLAHDGGGIKRLAVHALQAPPPSP